MKITRILESVDLTPAQEVNEQDTELLQEADTATGEDPTVRKTETGIEVDVAMTSMGTDAEPATPKESIKIKNALTDILDRAFDDAKYALEEENFDANCNVLVDGLPGSSKTATIRNWCKANGCNLYYLDAKNPDLQLLTSGAASIDKTDPKHPEVAAAYSRALAKLDRPNSVLFLDELNRQVKQYLRGSLYTLLADRRVAGDDEEGFRYFPNLLFTIAAVNPPVEGDKGATELSPAELRRFYYQVEFHSEVPTTRVFIKEYYDKKIIELVNSRKEAGLTSKDIARIDSFCLRQWIGLKLILDPDFHYTTVDEYMAKTEKGQITCQSTITELIDHSRGDIERLTQDINGSGLTKSAKVMLISIIEKMVLPNVEALRARKASELGLDLGAPVDTPTVVDEPEEDDDDIVKPEDFLSGREDDAEFYDDGSGAAATAVDADKLKASKVSDAAIISRLTDYTKKWTS